MVVATFSVPQVHPGSKKEQWALFGLCFTVDQVPSAMQNLAAEVPALEGELPDQPHGPHVTAGNCVRLCHPSPRGLLMQHLCHSPHKWDLIYSGSYFPVS